MCQNKRTLSPRTCFPYPPNSLNCPHVYMKGGGGKEGLNIAVVSQTKWRQIWRYFSSTLRAAAQFVLSQKYFPSHTHHYPPNMPRFLFFKKTPQKDTMVSSVKRARWLHLVRIWLWRFFLSSFLFLGDGKCIKYL